MFEKYKLDIHKQFSKPKSSKVAVREEEIEDEGEDEDEEKKEDEGQENDEETWDEEEIVIFYKMTSHCLIYIF